MANTTIRESRTARNARDVDNLQVAQVLADLNELQHASDQTAALSLLQPSTSRSSAKSLSTPQNPFSSSNSSRNRSTSSGIHRLNTGPPTPAGQNNNNNINNNETTPSTSLASHAARLRAESSGSSRKNTRPPITPLRRGESYTSTSESTTSIPSIQQLLDADADPDLNRALTLLNLHSTRTTLQTTPNSISSPSSIITTTTTTNPWMTAPSSSNTSSSINPSLQTRSPSRLDLARQDISVIAEQYERLKEMEMARDPVGMRAVLEEFGIPVEETGSLSCTPV